MTSPRRTPLQIADADPRTCSHDVRVRSLARVPFFAGLSQRALADVDSRCGMRGVDADEVVYRAGQPATRLYVIAQGAVKLSRRTSEGRDLLTDVLGSGEHFGTLPALGEERYADSARALTPGCMLSLDTAQLGAVLDAYPQVARAALTAIAGRLRDAQDRAHRLSAATAEQRLAATLLLLADRLGIHRGEQLVINAPLTRDELAGLAGLAPETASRILAQLRRDGAIDTGRRWVAVRDRPALEALATS